MSYNFGPIFWLMKSEPDVFSIDMLIKKRTEFWDGVRNYQARNFMMQQMKVGHKILFYHSNASPSGVAGVCEVVESAKPDLSAQNPKSEYFDPKATVLNPRWYGVTVGNPVKFKKFISLEDMRGITQLQDMLLLKKGQRLSVLPLKESEFRIIVERGMN
jgi:predicted RNA-binding protein with PUA-like domain